MKKRRENKTSKRKLLGLSPVNFGIVTGGSLLIAVSILNANKQSKKIKAKNKTGL